MLKISRRLLLVAAAAASLLAGAAAAAEAQKAGKAEGKSGAADIDQFEGEFGKEDGKAAKPVSDPLSGYNRVMFYFNDKVYLWLLKPVSKVYGVILPEPVRVAVDRGFQNLGFPIRFVNSALQGKFAGAGRELGRFAVNSTVGVGGLFDPAQRFMKLSPSDEDFGQTFGHWGIGPGFPLVLPLLGQSNLRDAVGLAPNSFLNPVYYVTDFETYLIVTGGGFYNRFSLHINDYEKIKKDALDPYTFMRDAHLQMRAEKIKE